MSVFVYSSLHSCHDIVLRRNCVGSWGFSIVGGYEENHTNQPFFIKTIVLGTPAYYDGRLKWVLLHVLRWFTLVVGTLQTGVSSKFSLVSAPGNKVLLEHGPGPSLTCCLRLLLSYSGSLLWPRPHDALRLKYSPSGPLQKNLCQPWSKLTHSLYHHPTHSCSLLI